MPLGPGNVGLPVRRLGRFLGLLVRRLGRFLGLLGLPLGLMPLEQGVIPLSPGFIPLFPGFIPEEARDHRDEERQNCGTAGNKGPPTELPVCLFLFLQPQRGLLFLVAPCLFLAFPRLPELTLSLFFIGHAAFLSLAAGFEQPRFALLQGTHPWKTLLDDCQVYAIQHRVGGLALPA